MKLCYPPPRLFFSLEQKKEVLFFVNRFLHCLFLLFVFVLQNFQIVPKMISVNEGSKGKTTNTEEQQSTTINGPKHTVAQGEIGTNNDEIVGIPHTAAPQPHKYCMH